MVALVMMSPPLALENVLVGIDLPLPRLGIPQLTSANDPLGVIIAVRPPQHPSCAWILK
jgi:hypothetical protein